MYFLLSVGQRLHSLGKYKRRWTGIHPGHNRARRMLWRTSPFDSSLYAANAIANCDSVLLRLNKTTFRQLLREYPDLHFSFSKLISARLRFKFLLLKELACNDPEQRIVALLSYLKTNRKNICHDCNRVNLTRQQIANMTGLRVETVIRTIKSLQQKGTLFIDKGKVYC